MSICNINIIRSIYCQCDYLALINELHLYTQKIVQVSAGY